MWLKYVETWEKTVFMEEITTCNAYIPGEKEEEREEEEEERAEEG